MYYYSYLDCCCGGNSLILKHVVYIKSNVFIPLSVFVLMNHYHSEVCILYHNEFHAAILM